MISRIGGLVTLLCAIFPSISFAASGFSFAKIADTSTPVPGGQFGNFTSVRLLASDGANIAFVGSYEFEGAGYSGLYQYHGGQIDTIADLSVASPGGGAFEHVLAGNDFVDKNLVFGASTSSGVGIYRLDGTRISTVVAPGAVLPETGGTIGLLEAKGVSGDATSAAFAGANSSAHGVLFQHANDQLSLIASDQTSVPGTNPEVFYSFPELQTRSGQTLFVANVPNPLGGELSSIPAGVFWTKGDGSIRPIVTRATHVPDDPDFLFNQFSHPRIGEDGRFYFSGGFLSELDRPTRGGPDVEPPDHMMDIYAVDAKGNVEVIVSSEQHLPGLRSEIEQFTGYSLDPAQPERVFAAVDEFHVTYIYVEDPHGRFDLVIDSTQLLDGKHLTSVSIPDDSTSNGVTSFLAEFTDGSSAIYSFAIPEPPGVATWVAVGASALARRRLRPVSAASAA